ncbi:hypothetical protein niasHS_014928 [Heterodera schachtii]|uniref:HIT-type domain-containing protein n=1 Tax=Heterodera schachtii TaxID=97005 RepID=A0ABD2J4H3_HETSC
MATQSNFGKFQQRSSRQSSRIISQQPTKCFDEAAKRRRIQQQLESLEKDNFQEDPHANITWHKAAPKFDDEMVFGDKEKKRRKRKIASPSKVSGAEQATKKGKKIVAALTKTRFRKTFAQLLEEAQRKREEETQQRRKEASPELLLPTYYEVASSPSKMPSRKFCAVCGLFAGYTCVRCSARFCSIPCKDMHLDTRCLKWTV